MSKVQDIAAQAKRLQNDDTFQSVLQEVREAQMAAFLDAGSILETREEAHVIIRALGEIERVITSRIENGRFEQHKDQHRGND